MPDRWTKGGRFAYPQSTDGCVHTGIIQSEGDVLSTIRYIDESGALQAAADEIIGGKRDLYVDFEGEFNLHRYGMHLCLVQCFDGETCTIVDTVRLDNPAALRAVFTSPDVRKVMFSCRSDLNLLHHVYGYQMRNVEDLQIAAKLLDLPKLSLGTVLEHFLDVRLPSNKKNQRANWNVRPLRPELIEYAAADVLHLPDLEAAVTPLLTAAGLKESYHEMNRALESIRYTPKRDPHLNIKGARYLSRKARVYLANFFNVRERIARELDMSPHSVIPNDVLIRISDNPPRGEGQWLSGAILSKRASRYAGRLSEATAEADRELERIDTSNQR